MCTKPLIGIKYGVDNSTGKWKIKLKRRLDWSLQDYYNRYGKENVVLIPCGKCSSCILARRREWSVRCCLEASCHDRNCFVTLTYDDEHYPDYVTWKNDYKRFIKSLRNDGFKVRYFGCGELGSNLKRRHLHIILFGFMPDDIEYTGDSDSGESLYSSKYLESIWKKGFVVVQLFGDKVGSYVAGYTSKKLGCDEGFQFQSTRPGIGYDYFLNHKDELLKYDRVFGSFGSAKLPRYFEKVLGESLLLDLIKDERIDKTLISQYFCARLHGFNYVDESVYWNRSFDDNKLKQLVRYF